MEFESEINELIDRFVIKTAAVALFAYMGQASTQAKYEEVARGVMDDVVDVDTLFLNFKQTRIVLRSLGLEQLTASQAAQMKKEVGESIALADKNVADLQKSTSIPGKKELMDKIVESWSKFKIIGGRVITAYDSGTPEDRKVMFEIFFKDCPEAAADFMSKANALRDHLAHQQDFWVKEARATASASTNWLLLIAGLGILGSMIFGFILANSVSKSISKITSELELGADQVSSASTQIASTSQGLSQSSSSQAASLEETVSTVEELSAMVKLNSESAKEAARLSGEARTVATNGEQEIKILVSSIHEIASDSKKIEDIINVIDDIAFQTNLLALNAAVEAARAGEQGKGFAVVAEAVRNLAQRSSAAAKDISGLIKSSVEKIDKGSVQAAQGGKVLGEIVSSVHRVAVLNQEIATASDEQATGINQISKVMSNLDGITQKNAAAAEESAASSEELSAQAMNLKAGLQTLSGVIDGSKTPGPSLSASMRRAA